MNLAADVAGFFDVDIKESERQKNEQERTYKKADDKLQELNIWLPRLKDKIREFFEISSGVNAVFIQIDDFYHLKRVDQPFVMDYVHRLCKDLPYILK